jgi:hypothetical protein
MGLQLEPVPLLPAGMVGRGKRFGVLVKKAAGKVPNIEGRFKELFLPLLRTIQRGN